jgi:hypothetical protein
LFDRLLEYGGDSWAEDVLLPWVEENPGQVAELHEIGAPGNHRVAVEREPRGHSFLWGLYALSRVVDVLISPFQPVNDDPDILAWTYHPPGPWWRGRIPSAEAYAPFMEAMGCTRIRENGSIRSSTRSLPSRSPPIRAIRPSSSTSVGLATWWAPWSS